MDPMTGVRLGQRDSGRWARLVSNQRPLACEASPAVLVEGRPERFPTTGAKSWLLRFGSIRQRSAPFDPTNDPTALVESKRAPGYDGVICFVGISRIASAPSATPVDRGRPRRLRSPQVVPGLRGAASGGGSRSAPLF